MDFAHYTDATLSSFNKTSKPKEVIAKKQEILRTVCDYHNCSVKSVLYVGFTPSMIDCTVDHVYVTAITKDTQEWLKSNEIKHTYIDFSDLPNYEKKFDVVVALDEYFTFAKTDKDQQDQIKLLCSLAQEFVISTLKDYKNLDFKEREFSQPAMVRNNDSFTSYFEVHDWDFKDRSSWKTQVYEISNDNEVTAWGPFARKTMYFKQLAKFSHDAGATDFTVHKNLMYKSLIKKNYEHVISIRFEDGY